MLFQLCSFSRAVLSVLAASTVAILFTIALPAHADTIYFSYAGTGPDTTASGTGSFSYVGSPSTLTLSDLTGFSFTDTVVFAGTSDETTYTLPELTSFSATLSGDTLLTLSLQTEREIGSIPQIGAELFEVNGLGPNDSATAADTNPDDESSFGQVTQTGSLTDSATPEPSTLLLLATGILSLAGAARGRLPA